MENRAFISLPKRSVKFGPVTIPLKYRFGRSATIDGVKRTAKDECIADANIGLFGGYKFARYRVRNDGGKLRDRSSLGGSIGAFLSLSSTMIDSLSTHISPEPLDGDEKYNIGVISPSFGVMFSPYNVQIGGFLGWDFGFGSNRKKWNFHGRPWLGFGLGYNLGAFWKS